MERFQEQSSSLEELNMELGEEAWISTEEAERNRKYDKFPLDVTGRKEYKEGLIPLDFKGELSDGSFIRVTQDEGGFAKIVIEKDGEEEIDFSKFLPQGYVFVTPRFILDKKNPGRNPGIWEVDRHKHVSIGDWTKPEHIFILLHELGHTTPDSEGNRGLRGEILEKEGHEKNRSARHELLRKEAELVSKDERNAWSFALHLNRQIRAELGINLAEEMFKNDREFEEFINTPLHSYKESFQSDMIDSEENRKFLKELFDKERQ